MQYVVLQERDKTHSNCNRDAMKQQTAQWLASQPVAGSSWQAESADAHLVVRYGELWCDVYKRLSNKARLVGFYEGVAGDNSSGFLDLHQHIHLLQAWLHTQHTSNRHTPYLHP